MFSVYAISFFYFSSKMENKAEKTEQGTEWKDFQENCKRIEYALNAQDLKKLESALPRSRKIMLEMREMHEIKKASLELIKEAKKIGPTDEGNYKLDKAMEGSMSLSEKIIEITRAPSDESGGNPNKFRGISEEKSIIKEI